MNTSETKPNVVIVGGSYVGNKAVDLITPLVHKTHNVILIEKNSHFRHLFAFPRMHAVTGFEQKAMIPYTQPISGSVASFFSAVNAVPPASATATEAAEGFAPLPSDSIKIVTGAVTSILPDKVLLSESGASVSSDTSIPSSIPYDFLVLATGTGVPAHAFVGVNKKFGVEITRMHQENVRRAQNIVIVGGGAYGIQLATDLKTHAPTQSKHVTLVHSRGQLLNRFHPGLHDIALQRCKDLGIDVVLGRRVVIPEGGFPMETTDTEFEVGLGDGESVKADLVILCTGPVPLSKPLLTLAPSAVNEQGYVKVKPTLQVDAVESSSTLSSVFAIGDVADTGAHKAARPGVAQATVVAKNIEKILRAREAHAHAQNGNSNGKDIDLETYSFDTPGIHLSLGLNASLKFRNPTTPYSEPWISWDEPGSQKLDAGCEKMWIARAPWALKDGEYHL